MKCFCYKIPGVQESRFELNFTSPPSQKTHFFYICSRPTMRMEQLDYHWTDFHDCGIGGLLRNLSKIQVRLKSDKRGRNFA
jgi:hypothetical protein